MHSPKLRAPTPAGSKRLNRAQNPFHLGRRGLDFRQQAQADIFQRVFQVAVVVDGVGDDPRNRHVDGAQIGEFQLLDELFLQRLPMPVAEVAAAVVIAGPGSIRRAAGLFAPGFIGDFHFRLFALIGGRGVAVEFGVLLLRRRLLTLPNGLRTGIERLLFRLEHHIGLERLADVGLQIERGQLQQSDGLLQLRRHGELLADAKLQTWLQHNSFRSKPTV